MIKSKLSKTNAVIYRGKYLLDKNSFFILYCSLFRIYHTAVKYVAICIKHILMVFIYITIKVVRLICNENSLCHSNKLFCDLWAFLSSLI